MVYAYGGSIAANPRVALIDITQNGTDWLWTVFALMVASGMGMTVWAHSLGTGRRAFHYTAAALLFTASVAYFSMASDLGGVAIDTEFNRVPSSLYSGDVRPVTRSIWYVRYIDWVITTPLLLLTLLLGTGLPLSTIFFTVFMDEVMIVAGLVGALVASSYKWGYFVFGMFALFYVVWILVGPARKSAYLLSPEAGRAYTSSSLILSFLWFIYPIAWGLCDGGNVISTDGEMVFYGVLDLLAKPVFTFYHMFMLSKVPYEQFQLQSGHATAFGANNGLVGDNALLNGHAEKGALNGHANGHTNGYPVSGAANGPAAPATTDASATTETGHPNVAQQFAHGTEPTHTAPGAGVVQHTTATA